MEILTEGSLRQQAFEFLDINPFVKNKGLYKQFPEESQSSLRQYKMQWLSKIESLGDILTQPSLTKILYNFLMNRRPLESFESSESTVNPHTQSMLYPQVANNHKTKEDYQFHIIPLIKTFKILPLYIFKKCYDIIDFLQEEKLSVVDILSILIDLINLGNYKIEDISDFTLHNTKELKDFLAHPSWKKDCIKQINEWIGIKQNYYRDPEMEKFFGSEYFEKKELKPLEFYKQLKGKIIYSLLPQFYGIYLFKRKKEYILQDLSKVCFIYNQSNESKPLSLSQIVEKYNNGLIFYNRSSKYHIDLGYDESPEFLYEN